MSTALATKPTLNLDAVKGITPADRAAIQAVFADLAGAADSILRAARRWVALAEDVRERVTKELPAYMVPFMNRLARVGSGTLHPQLYAVGGRAAITLGRLPIEQQDLYLTERIPVAIVKADGRPDVRRMDVADMGHAEYMQVFERHPDRSVTVRTVAQQRAWLADRAAKESAARVAGRTVKINRAGKWKVMGTRVYVDDVKVRTGLTRQDLLLMLKDTE